MALFGVSPIGCNPNALAQNSPHGRTFVARINYANQLSNNDLRSLVDQLNNHLRDARFIYGGVDAKKAGVITGKVGSPLENQIYSHIEVGCKSVTLEQFKWRSEDCTEEVARRRKGHAEGNAVGVLGMQWLSRRCGDGGWAVVAGRQ
ncbi:GDSL esterase/lipase, partial [Mucuna pruriens]